jgi:hypothetical protein
VMKWQVMGGQWSDVGRPLIACRLVAGADAPLAAGH